MKKEKGREKAPGGPREGKKAGRERSTTLQR
jgi:hypothetical protein